MMLAEEGGRRIVCLCLLACVCVMGLGEGEAFAKKKKYASDFPPRYSHRWDSRCPTFKISRRTCYRATRRGQVKRIHKLIMTIFAWWQKELDNTSPHDLKRIQAKRDKYFHVSRWWWDRYRRDKQFWAMDIIDRMLQPVLLRYPQRQYEQVLAKAASLLSHKAMSRPREVGLLSRISRWLKRRHVLSVRQRVVRRLRKQIFAEKKCHWWSLVFITTFDPGEMKRIGPKISPTWCKYRRYYLRSKFRMPSEIAAALRVIQRKFPRVVRMKSYGKSAEGRPLWGLEIGMIRDPNAPTSLLIGSQHGDEHMGAELLTHYTQQLMARYKRGEKKVRNWLQTRRLIIIPMLNPDGCRFDILGGVIKWWRYNRGVQRNGEIGIDLNRNWDFKWKKYSYYRWGRIELPGRKPFSEPETAAIQKLSWRIRNLTGILDVHQSGSVVLTPWAYTRKQLPSMYRRLFFKIGRYMTAANGYRVRPARSLYPHQATLGDWGFGRHKVVSLVLELGRTVYVNERQKKNIYRSNKLLLDRFIHLALDPFRMIRTVRAGTSNRSN